MDFAYLMDVFLGNRLSKKEMRKALEGNSEISNYIGDEWPVYVTTTMPSEDGGFVQETRVGMEFPGSPNVHFRRYFDSAGRLIK